MAKKNHLISTPKLVVLFSLLAVLLPQMCMAEEISVMQGATVSS